MKNKKVEGREYNVFISFVILHSELCYITGFESIYTIV